MTDLGPHTGHGGAVPQLVVVQIYARSHRPHQWEWRGRYPSPSSRMNTGAPTDSGEERILLGWIPSAEEVADPTPAQHALLPWHATIRIIRLSGSFVRPAATPQFRHDQFSQRWAFRFTAGVRDDIVAQRIADAIDGLLHLLWGPPSDESLSHFMLPSRLISRRGVVKASEVLLEDSSPSRDVPVGEMGLMHSFGCGVCLPWNVGAELWRLLPASCNEQVFSALMFLRTSLQAAFFSPGDIWDIRSFDTLADAPTSETARTSFESAHLQAYRAIEALIGEPNKNDHRFREALVAAGLDPDENAGMYRRTDVASLIKEVQATRDARTGHGRRRRAAPISYREAVEVQELARRLVHIRASKLADVAASRPRAQRGASR